MRCIDRYLLFAKQFEATQNASHVSLRVYREAIVGR
jgi:hypothetical protein